MSSIMFPYLCGGEALDIRKIKLEPKHYLQEDKSLNAHTGVSSPSSGT